MRYKKSYWVHIFEDDNKFALFNADNLTIFFGDKDLVALFKTFETPTTKNEVLTSFNIEEQILSTLIDKGFIVPEILSEKELFMEKSKKIRARYLDINSKDVRLNAMRIVITERCNFTCKYCFVNYQRGINHPKDMSRETLLKSIDFLIDNNPYGTINLQFFGGEPLLRYDLITYGIEYVNNCIRQGKLKEAEFSLATNGVLLTDEICKYFKDNNVNVNISIDGPPQFHDKCRVFPNRRGTYTDTIKGLNLLKKHGNDIYALLTPTEANCKNLSECFEFLVNDLEVKHVGLNTPQAKEGGRWNVDPVELSNQIKKALLICKKYNAILNSPASRVLIGLDKREPQILSCARMDDSEEITVAPDGTVSFCIITWYVEQCLDSIERFKVSNRFKDWKYFSAYGLEKCFQCSAINLCGGPCALENHYLKLTGSYDHDRCLFYKDFINWAIWQ